MAEAEIKQQQISVARAAYQPVATRSSLLYFLINDLSQIDPMYQFSLAYFSKLFNNIIDITPHSDNQSERIAWLIANSTAIVYDNICRGLFNRHKKIFSFLMAVRIELNSQKLTPNCFSIFLKGVVPLEITKTIFVSAKIPKLKYQMVLGMAK